jgi:HSP20 family molecular chaperone IbpA
MSRINPPELNQLLQDIADGLASETPSIRFVNKGASEKPSAYPLTDICLDEERDFLHIEIAAPGFSNEDFDISISDNILLIKGNISEQTIADDAEMKYFQKQIEKKSFIRKIKLRPEFSKSENIHASTENGILTVSIVAETIKEPTAKKIKVY